MTNEIQIRAMTKDEVGELVDGVISHMKFLNKQEKFGADFVLNVIKSILARTGEK